MRAGLTRRFAAAAAIGLLVLTLSVAALILALRHIDQAQERSHRAERTTVQVALAVRLVVDLETGSRGLALTGDPSFLEPWQVARQELPALLASIGQGADDQAQLDELTATIDDYVEGWQVPLIELLEADPEAGRQRIATGEGKRRVDAIRAEASDLSTVLLEQAEDEAEATDDAMTVAVAVAIAGTAASALLVVLAALALRRRVTRPLEDVARAAERIATGDTGARVQEDGQHEIGALQRAFNSMAASLQEREAALDAAREAAERQAAVNSAVLETTPDALLLIGPDGAVVLANRTMERLISDIIGEPAGIGERLRTGEEIARAVEPHVADTGAYRSSVERVLAAPHAEHVHTYRVPHLDRTFLRLSTEVREADGTPLGTLVLTRDVSAERAAERAKDDLMAAVSHELRTPLASVLGFAELLETRELEASVQRRYAATIHREARRLTALVDDLIDLRLIEQGRLALAPEPTDVATLVRQQVELFVRRGSGHAFHVDTPAAPLIAVVDRLRLEQVLGNLLSNAVKYSPDGGPIAVTATRHGDAGLRITVTDTGVGIPESQQGGIFQRFFRADRPAIRRIAGTGIGLALTRDLVTVLGGEIGFTSREGEGSTFWVDLPLAAAAPDHGQPASPR